MAAGRSYRSLLTRLGGANRCLWVAVTPDELGGGTFTLTNTGSRGALFDTPIINQPQVAILGVGAIEKRPKVVTGADGEQVGVMTRFEALELAASQELDLIGGQQRLGHQLQQGCLKFSEPERKRHQQSASLDCRQHELHQLLPVLFQVREHADLFQQILAGCDHPLVIHCSAGKDRTGVAIGLLLRLAGWA